VRKTETCWIWDGGRAGTGYGLFHSESGKTVPAHRYAYELLRGAIPAGLELDHLCRVRDCVNPDHLELVTHAENLRRGNGWSGRNLRKTHCVEGHPFDAENTRIRRGSRECKKCHTAMAMRRKRRKRAKASGRPINPKDAKQSERSVYLPSHTVLLPESSSTPRRLVETVEDRFWEKVEKSDSCWLWLGSKHGSGHGNFYDSRIKKVVPAHTFSYELSGGIVPQGMVIDHLCRVPSCVNPAHLEVVSRGENVLRGIGIYAVNARKTSCANGHLYDEANTVRYGDGYRKCRICLAESRRKWRERSLGHGRPAVPADNPLPEGSPGSTLRHESHLTAEDA
jgi:hypothetical protein